MLNVSCKSRHEQHRACLQSRQYWLDAAAALCYRLPSTSHMGPIPTHCVTPDPHMHTSRGLQHPQPC